MKLDIPIFSKSQQIYYEEMRNSIKMWQNDYSVIYEILKEAYNVSDDYFGNACKPIAKNMKLNTNLVINSKWESRQFRNAMAHYKLGIALKEEELLSEDKLFGLTQKYFKSDYLTVKKKIMQEMKNLACQIGDYLQLKDTVIKVKR